MKEPTLYDKICRILNLWIFGGFLILILLFFFGCSPNYFTNLAKRYEPYNFIETSEITQPIDTNAKYIFKRDTTIIQFNTPEQKTQIVYTPAGRDTSIIYINATTEPDTIKQVVQTTQPEAIQINRFIVVVFSVLITLFFITLLIITLKK